MRGPARGAVDALRSTARARSRPPRDDAGSASDLPLLPRPRRLERFADAALTCPANGLNSKAGSILKSLCDEFNDLKSIDKIASVQVRRRRGACAKWIAPCAVAPAGAL